MSLRSQAESPQIKGPPTNAVATFLPYIPLLDKHGKEGFSGSIVTTLHGKFCVRMLTLVDECVEQQQLNWARDDMPVAFMSNGIEVT